MEHSGICTGVVMKCFCFDLDCSFLPRNSIALLPVIYFGNVKGLFGRACFFSHCYPEKLQETASLSVQFQFCVNENFCQIDDFHFLVLGLLFPSVMSLFYGDLSTMFSRRLSDVYEKLIVMVGPVEVRFVQSM